ncbi:recombinase family protein [Acidaminobacterium chupaoyuni]
MARKKHTALYIRVSTDAQFEEGYSIDAQKEMLEGFCKSRGIKEYKFYIDGGFTGSNIRRPGMQKMMEAVENDQISAVVVYKLDRLSRSQKDTLYLIEDVFAPHHTDFVSLNENMDTSTPIGRAMLGIMSAFAQLERETIRERTRMGMRERVKQGYWPGGGKIPFGYDYDDKNGILVPNEDAKTVQTIYRLYLQGYSAEKIASMLGLKYDRLVMQILSRRTNVGVIPYNGAEYPGRHEAIIDEKTFQLAQDEMEKRAKLKTPVSEYLLTGLIYCGKCGAKMRYQKWGKAGVKLVCYSQQKTKPYLVHDPSCDNARPWADEVEEAVLRDLFLFAADCRAEENEEKQGEEPLRLLENQLDQSKNRLRRLYRLYAESDEELLMEEIEREKNAAGRLKQQIEEEKRHGTLRQKQNELKEKVKNLEEAWPYLKTSEKQAILRAIVRRVVISGENIEVEYQLT